MKSRVDLRIDTAHVKTIVKESYATILSVQHSSWANVLPGILQGSILGFILRFITNAVPYLYK